MGIVKTISALNAACGAAFFICPALLHCGRGVICDVSDANGILVFHLNENETVDFVLTLDENLNFRGVPKPPEHIYAPVLQTVNLLKTLP